MDIVETTQVYKPLIIFPNFPVQCLCFKIKFEISKLSHMFLLRFCIHGGFALRIKVLVSNRWKRKKVFRIVFGVLKNRKLCLSSEAINWLIFHFDWTLSKLFFNPQTHTHTSTPPQDLLLLIIILVNNFLEVILVVGCYF